MPPPARPASRPMPARASTTSDVHRTISQKRVSRRSIEPPTQSPRKPSMDSSRPPLSSRTSHSSGGSTRNVHYADAPPSPVLRRQIRPISDSFHEIRPEEHQATMAEDYIGQTTPRNVIDTETVHHALEKRPKTKMSRSGRSGRSDTTSRTSSRSGEKKSKRRSRDRDDEDVITVRTRGITLDMKGRGSVTFKQEGRGTSVQLGHRDESESREPRESSSGKRYITSGSSVRSETEVNRSGRSRSRAPDELSRVPTNSTLERVKKTGSSSRRSSAAPRPRDLDDETGGIPFN